MIERGSLRRRCASIKARQHGRFNAELSHEVEDALQARRAILRAFCSPYFGVKRTLWAKTSFWA
jgi:hypothetical protein